VRTTYELLFDSESGKFRQRKIVAEVLRSGFDAPCEIENATVEFPEDVFELTTAFAPGDTEYDAEVFLRDEVYGSEDFLSILEKEFEFVFNLTPREYDDSGSYALAPPVRGSCSVKCGEVPTFVEILEPAKEMFPIPAVGEESTELLLKVSMGKNGPPRIGMKLQWERLTGGCTPQGKLEAVSEMTDGEGCFRMSYTAPKLSYREGRKFFEEYRFFRQSGQGEEEVFRLKIPLAPGIVFKIRAEKIAEFEELSYGLVSELGETIEIDPGERVKIVETRFEAEVDADEDHRTFPVRNMVVHLYPGNEDGVDAEGDGIVLKTDETGLLRWEIPELVEAFGDLGTTYTISKESPGHPEVKTTDAALEDLDDYRQVLQRPKFPWDVFEADATLTIRLKRYPFVFTRHLCEKDPVEFEKVRASLKILRTAATYTGPFRTSYRAEFQPLVGRVGNMFWDLFGLAWNLFDWGGSIADSLIEKIGPYARRFAEQFAEHTPAFLQRFAQWTSKVVSAKLRAIVLRLEGLVERIGKALPSLSSIWTSVEAGFSKLLSRIDKIISITVPHGTSTRRALEAMGEWLERSIRTALGMIGDVLKVIGRTLILIIGKLAQIAIEIAGRMTRSLADVVQYCDDTAVKRAIDAVMEFVRSLGYKEIGRLTDPLQEGLSWSLSKYLEAVSGWIWKLLNDLGDSMSVGALTRSITSFEQVSYFNPMASKAVERVHRECRELRTPLDWAGERSRLRETAVSIKHQQFDREMGNVEFDFLMDCVDLAVLCVETGVALAAVFFSGGAAGSLALTLMNTFQKIEVAVSSVKVLVKDLPQVFLVFSASASIMFVHNVATYNLTVGP